MCVECACVCVWVQLVTNNDEALRTLQQLSCYSSCLSSFTVLERWDIGWGTICCQVIDDYSKVTIMHIWMTQRARKMIFCSISRVLYVGCSWCSSYPWRLWKCSSYPLTLWKCPSYPFRLWKCPLVQWTIKGFWSVSSGSKVGQWNAGTVEAG